MRSGVSWSAPKAAAYAHAESSAVTRVTRRSSGENSAPKLGRCKVPAARFSRQTCDSGTKGSSSAIGIAGSRPVISK